MPSWRREIEESLGNVNMVLGKVEGRMEEFMVWINHFKESNRSEDIPADVMNSIQELIQDTSAAFSVKDYRYKLRRFRWRFLMKDLEPIYFGVWYSTCRIY